MINMVAQNANYENIFFSLLRSGLYGVEVPGPELPDDIEWEPIIALAKKHAVFGIIIESVQFLPERLRPSAPIMARMNKFALGLFQANLVLDKTAARLVAFFRQHGISGVLLKGQGVARYYRLPQMRQCGDIDFYVGKSAYKKAKGLCAEYLIDANCKGDESEQHYGFDMDGVHIELHRLATRIYSPLRKKAFQAWIVEQLEHSSDRRTMTIGSVEIALHSYEFDAIYVFYHAWRHFIMGGIGLRQLCDWSMIFHSHGDDIDEERLKANIYRFGLEQGWKLFASIAVKYLGVPPDKMPLYDPSYHKKSEKIFQEIMDGGNFGYYSEATARAPIGGIGLKHGLNKVRNVTGYFISLFPIIPAEATFLYFHRLFYGTIAHTLRTIRHRKS